MNSKPLAYGDLIFIQHRGIILVTIFISRICQWTRINGVALFLNLIAI